MKIFKFYSLLGGLLVFVCIGYFLSRSKETPGIKPENHNQEYEAEKSIHLKDTLLSLLKGDYPNWQVLDSIQKKTGATFHYSNNVIPDSITLSKDLNKVTFQHALEVIFNGTEIRWKYRGLNVMLMGKDNPYR